MSEQEFLMVKIPPELKLKFKYVALARDTTMSAIVLDFVKAEVEKAEQPTTNPSCPTPQAQP